MRSKNPDMIKVECGAEELKVFNHLGEQILGIKKSEAKRGLLNAKEVVALLEDSVLESPSPSIQSSPSQSTPPKASPSSDSQTSSGGLPKSRFEAEYSSRDLHNGGSFGQVFKVINDLDEQTYAVKLIEGISPSKKQEAFREAKYLAIAKHKNVVEYHCAWMNTESELCICMEFYQSTLADWLDGNRVLSDDDDDDDSPRNVNDEEERGVHIFRQLIEGLCHVHSKGIIHFDLSPANIFLDNKNVPKIGDFGLAVKLEQGVSSHPWCDVGNALYKAPEMMENLGPVTQRVDIFAMGLIFLQLLCQSRLPNTIGDLTSIFDDIRRGTLPPVVGSLPAAYKYLVRSMLFVTPSQRPTADVIRLTLDGRKRPQNF